MLGSELLNGWEACTVLWHVEARRRRAVFFGQHLQQYESEALNSKFKFQPSQTLLQPTWCQFNSRLSPRGVSFYELNEEGKAQSLPSPNLVTQVLFIVLVGSSLHGRPVMETVLGVIRAISM